jgi:hypothetical protein
LPVSSYQRPDPSWRLVPPPFPCRIHTKSKHQVGGAKLAHGARPRPRVQIEQIPPTLAVRGDRQDTSFSALSTSCGSWSATSACTTRVSTWPSCTGCCVQHLARHAGLLGALGACHLHPPAQKNARRQCHRQSQSSQRRPPTHSPSASGSRSKSAIS